MLVYAWMVFVEKAPERYDLGMKIMTLGRLDRIKEMIAARIQPGDEILDIGCGTGTLAIRCIGKGARVTGLDSCRFMLDEAEKNASAAGVADRLELIKESVTQIPKHFPEARFSKVVATMSLGEFPKGYLEFIFRECRRVLREGGELIIADELQPQGRIARWLYNLVMALFWIPQFLIVRRVCYPIRDIDTLLEQAGFEVRERRKFPFSTLQLVVAEKRAAGGEPTP